LQISVKSDGSGSLGAILWNYRIDEL